MQCIDNQKGRHLLRCHALTHATSFNARILFIPAPRALNRPPIPSQHGPQAVCFGLIHHNRKRRRGGRRDSTVSRWPLAHVDKGPYRLSLHCVDGHNSRHRIRCRASTRQVSTPTFCSFRLATSTQAATDPESTRAASLALRPNMYCDFRTKSNCEPNVAACVLCLGQSTDTPRGPLPAHALRPIFERDENTP